MSNNQEMEGSNRVRQYLLTFSLYFCINDGTINMTRLALFTVNAHYPRVIK